MGKWIRRRGRKQKRLGLRPSVRVLTCPTQVRPQVQSPILRKQSQETPQTENTLKQKRRKGREIVLRSAVEEHDLTLGR